MSEVMPERIAELAKAERDLNFTIGSKLSLEEKVALGTADRLSPEPERSEYLALAMDLDALARRGLHLDNWRGATTSVQGSRPRQPLGP